MNRLPLLLFLVYLCIVVYISFYPFQFTSDPHQPGLVWLPIQTFGDATDFTLNVLLYVPLGALGFAALRRGWIGVLAASAVCGAISYGAEYTQLFIDSRGGDLRDLVANTLGGGLGALLVFTTSRPVVLQRLRAIPGEKIFLAAVWAFWQLALVVPREWTWIEWSHEALGMAILAFVLIGRVPRVVPYAMLVWLIFEEFRPFHFQEDLRPFSWIPFEYWFLGQPQTYYAPVLAKLFLYSAIVWAARKTGWSWKWAMTAPAAILIVGEWTQRYLPGRTPELTDLALVAAGAILLRLCEQRQPRTTHRLD